MSDILALPQDVHAIVWSELSLQDILHLRQTCSALSIAVSGDKQLWAHILDRDVKAQSLCLPYNSCAVKDVNAHDIESLVKHAVILKRNYAKADRKLFVPRIGNRLGFKVTWLKLIFGHWCLIASADSEQSELSVWEITSECEIRLVGRIYLEAPVIDGQLDDSSGQLRCAITVGTSIPYILILSISQSLGKVNIRQLTEIPDASHVRFLRGNLVGFAVQSGDDIHPYIADWSMGNSYKLCLPNDASSQMLSPVPLESCIAMTVKNGYIYTLHRTAIHVFASLGVSSADVQTEAKHVTKLPLIEEACDGQFIAEASTEPGMNQSGVFVRVYYQDLDSELRQALVLREDRPGEVPLFSVTEVLNKNPPGVSVPWVLHRYCIGLSARRVFCITSLNSSRWMSPVLSTANIHVPVDSGESPPYSTFGEYIPIPKDDLPLLHLVSCLDFDDGRGLLLLGTILGDVRLASFLQKDVITRGSLWDDLPEDLEERFRTSGSQRISQVAARLDLPVFYNIRKSYKLDDDLPPALQEEAVRFWHDQGNGLRPFSNWSNDWLLFRCVWDWITPFSRWGSLDNDFLDRNPSTIARNRLQALGEIIPVIYDLKDHKRVVFRVGERLFYCRSQWPTEDEESRADFEEEDDIILGILPRTYREFLSDPPSIIAHLSDYETQRNLREWASPRSLSVQSLVANTVFRIRRHQDSDLERDPDDATMEAWSNDEWDTNYRDTLKFV